MDGLGKIFVWGDVDVTWHYRQAAVDSAGPAKDRSQRKWSGAGAYGLSGLNIRQLLSLGAPVIHGLTLTDGHVKATREARAEDLGGESTLEKRLAELEQSEFLPIFGYSIGEVPKTRDDDKPVTRVREPYGWTACDWNLYHKLCNEHVQNAKSICGNDLPRVVLLNDAGWGCLRDYFGSELSLREWLAQKTGLPIGRSHPDPSEQAADGSYLCVKTRIYPPIEYREEPAFSSFRSRNKPVDTPLPIDPRLIVITGVTDLRLLGVNVSRGISWERTVQHLLWAAKGGFEHAKQIVGITEARFVVVTFGSDGVVLIDRKDKDDPSATLFFHGPDIEGDSERKMPGRTYGGTTWMSTILAYLLSHPDAEIHDEGWWKDALRLCLAFVRTVNLEGNILVKPDPQFGDISFGRKSAGEGQPKIAGWNDNTIEMCKGFSKWHDLRKQLRQIRDWENRNRILEAGNPLPPALASMEKPPEFVPPQDDPAYLAIKKTMEEMRLRYVAVQWSQIMEIQEYEGPADQHRRRKGLPDRFRKRWWSFLSLALTERALWEMPAGVENKSKRLAKAVVRYAFEVMRYGGWHRSEYFPFPLSIPYVEFGELRSCDRAEIENLRNFSSIISEYLRRKEQKPLNVAVFGPPGTGKSYAVREIINSLDSDKKPVFLTFNLSQFQSPAQLPACYQQIQNEVLKGHLPVVFWDEFDTTLNDVNFGWLHAFLAPMQDGEFIHEQRANKIGTCIFVFAGSRFDRFADLPEPSDSLEKPREEIVTMSFRDVLERARTEDLTPTPPQEIRRLELINLRRRQEDWRVAKGNDFRSRLKGYLDVQDCNLRPNQGEQAIAEIGEKDANTCDQLNFLIRRARMVRQHLLDNFRELFVRMQYPRVPHVDKENGRWQIGSSGSTSNIDVMTYLELKIGEEIAFGLLSPFSFIHGMRSIETILRISELSEKTRFERAFLQAAEMISVHIRPDAFEFPSVEKESALVEGSFDYYLDDWHNKYLEVIRTPSEVGRPVVEWKTAIIPDDREYPCLVYGSRIEFQDKDSDGEIPPREVLLSELPPEERPDRLEVLISHSDNTERPEHWYTIAYDRGSPYLLNAESYMFKVLGLERSRDAADVFVACRWWRNGEFGRLSKPRKLRLTRNPARADGGEMELSLVDDAEP